MVCQDGCKLGARPIDQHIKGFELLGANVTVEKGTILAKTNCLQGTSIYMDIVSVGATINVMLASVLAKRYYNYRECCKRTSYSRCC